MKPMKVTSGDLQVKITLLVQRSNSTGNIYTSLSIKQGLLIQASSVLEFQFSNISASFLERVHKTDLCARLESLMSHSKYTESSWGAHIK